VLAVLLLTGFMLSFRLREGYSRRSSPAS
jgi:hypothetical protein